MDFIVAGLRFSYKSKKILENIKFELKKGEIVAILGTNGAGKSTLLKNIAKVLKPQKGSVYLSKEDLHKLPVNKFAKKIGYVDQKSRGGNLSVFDTLLLGRKVYFNTSPSKEDLKKVDFIIKQLGFTQKAFSKTETLSGGELQKVVIARALLQESEVLLIDEPTNNLDVKNQLEILKLIVKYSKEKNILSIMVMHDINLALRFCDKFIFLKNGKITAEGTKEIITPRLLKEVYDIEARICSCQNREVIIFE